MDVKAKPKLTIIRDTLQTVLPSLLSAAGLDDFDKYLVDTPPDAEEKTLAVYVSENRYNTDFATLIILIQLQLYREKNVVDYHDVVMQAIADNIAAEDIDYDYIMRFESDVWPLNQNVSSAYVYYEIEFTGELDDCD